MACVLHSYSYEKKCDSPINSILLIVLLLFFHLAIFISLLTIFALLIPFAKNMFAQWGEYI